MIKNILVVEDEMLIAMIVEKQLKVRGYHVIGAVASGEEAISMCRSMSPDAILMDIKIAGAIDGIETAKRIKEEMPIPIVFVTSYDDRQTMDRAMELHPLGYLLKPLNMDKLVALFGAADPGD